MHLANLWGIIRSIKYIWKKKVQKKKLSFITYQNKYTYKIQFYSQRAKQKKNKSEKKEFFRENEIK